MRERILCNGETVLAIDEKTPKRAWVWDDLGNSQIDEHVEPVPISRLNQLRHGLKVARIGYRLRHGRLLLSSSITLVLLVLLVGILAVDAFSSLSLPAIFRQYHALTALAAIVLFFAVRTYSDALLTIGFYGRFIRPGLRRLLLEHGESLVSGKKLFRGRKTVVMKIDVVNFTATTFEMPYGVKRLFIDLWFIHMDQLVADKVFLDKSLGDGSLYYFEDGLAGGSCTAALRAAMLIRDQQVKVFDETFARFFHRKMEECPELAMAAGQYLTRYEKQHGDSFWNRATEVRISLVSGYVDEGLWGLSAQSHYDAHGTVPVLASRMESQAGIGEIVFDENFLAELETESSNLLDRSLLLQRVVEFKGIGERLIFVLPSLPV